MRVSVVATCAMWACLPVLFPCARAGIITEDTHWAGSVTVVESWTVEGSATLSIEPGTTLIMNPGVSIVAFEEASILMQGGTDSIIRIQRGETALDWSHIGTESESASLIVAHVDSSGGRFRIAGGAAVLEDSFIHDYHTWSIIESNAATVELRRCHVRDYFDINLNRSLVLAEDCLIEAAFLPNSDAFEMSNAPKGCVVRRCTFRHINGDNSDSLDLNSPDGFLIEDCIFEDVSDKAISIGGSGEPSIEAGIIRNCMIYEAGTGIAIKNGWRTEIQNLTVVDCQTGIRVDTAPDAPGGSSTAIRSVISWGNTAEFQFQEPIAASISYSLTGVQLEGETNLTGDPRFLDAAERDYRLAPESPASTAGPDSNPIGANFPIGSSFAPSQPMFEISLGENSSPHLQLRTDPERRYTVEARESFVDAWEKIGDISSGDRPALETFPITTESSAVGLFRVGHRLVVEQAE